MTNEEAKFILTAYRPGGQDATDPLFAESLAQAKRDPELCAWFKAQVAFDASMSARLRALQPPAGLRATILAGTHVSSRQFRFRHRWPWFAAVAAILVVLVFLATALWPATVRPELGELTRFALRDRGYVSMRHFGSVAAIREIEEQLAETRLLTGGELSVDLARLRAGECRTVRVAGREVFEICFSGDHEFHLYLAQHGDFAADDASEPIFTSENGLSAATWADSRFVYSLVTTAGADALRQQL